MAFAESDLDSCIGYGLCLRSLLAGIIKVAHVCCLVVAMFETELLKNAMKIEIQLTARARTI